MLLAALVLLAWVAAAAAAPAAPAPAAAPAAPVAPAAPAAPAALQVHLPRNVQVEADALSLGLVAVVCADDDALSRRAAAIPMGRAPLPKEEIVIDRATILGRLASSGIAASDVQLSGADKVVVARNEKTIAADEVARAAEGFLEKNRPAPQASRWLPTRAAQDMTVPAFEATRLEASLVPHEVTGEAKVEVAALAGGRRLAAQTVLFRLGYVQREAVTTADLSPGDVLTPGNVEIRTVLALAPPPDDWAPPYGFQAAQAMRIGTVVRPALVRSARPAVAVRRGENVAMRIRATGFSLRALGQALDDGRPGDLIKVRNVDSGRIVAARVAPDGDVEPIFDEVKK
jgi:flagella basal body P-ring formation protein FlgA